LNIHADQIVHVVLHFCYILLDKLMLIMIDFQN